jgi:hypothetical protein
LLFANSKIIQIFPFFFSQNKKKSSHIYVKELFFSKLEFSTNPLMYNLQKIVLHGMEIIYERIHKSN